MLITYPAQTVVVVARRACGMRGCSEGGGGGKKIRVGYSRRWWCLGKVVVISPVWGVRYSEW